jgi:UDP-N-acetyl-D-mannosaminuronic acid dehydrogenase
MKHGKRVSVIGLGYIGLPTAALIAIRGYEVLGVDVNPLVVTTLNAGKVHFVEPELDVLLSGAVASGRLQASLTPEPADVFIVAVPTPFKNGHQADLSYIEKAAGSIAKVLKAGDLVILESTSPVGTTEKLERWLREARPDLSFPSLVGEASDIRLAYCPERVLPGKIIHELVNNDRTIGGITAKCAEQAATFYGVFVEGKCLATNARTAEMVKLTENAFRDVNIAFANELSLVCDRLGIDVWKLIELANCHPRVNILQPGPGVGGHCIAVDPWFIVEQAPDLAKLIHTARLVNDGKPRWVIDKVKSAAKKIRNPRIACLGLAFKPDIDDLRESPSLEIAAHLAHEIDGVIYAVEPHVAYMPEPLAKYRNVVFMQAEAAITGADIVLMLVNHKVFQSIDRTLLQEKVVIDTRGAWR